MLVKFCVDVIKCKNMPIKCRDCHNYTKELLKVKLARVDWNINIDDVQQYWNVFQNVLINIIDEMVPLVNFSGNLIKGKVPKVIKNKINKQNRL